MIQLYLIAAVALIAMGVAIGVVLVVSIAIHRDDRAFRRRKVNATGYAVEGARRLLTGKRVPDPHPEPRPANPKDARV